MVHDDFDPPREPPQGWPDVLRAAALWALGAFALGMVAGCFIALLQVALGVA